MRSRFFDNFFLTLMIIGALYLGLVGLFGVDVFVLFLGNMPLLFAKILFGLIGVAGLYAFTLYNKIDDSHTRSHIE